MRRILTVKLLNEFAATDGKRPFDALGLGEVMLRLSPSGKERINQGQTFEKTAGGSELNVVSGISILGRRSGMIALILRQSCPFCEQANTLGWRLNWGLP